jgi:hypothetical protein
MEPLSPDNIAKIQTAMREGHSITSAELKAMGMNKLSDQQKDFVIWATQLNERAMSLRSVAGFGQGSESMRAAIQATLPGAGSGDKKTALKQLDAFDNQVSLLQKGVVKTPRAAKAEQAAPAAAPSASCSPQRNRRDRLKRRAPLKKHGDPADGKVGRSNNGHREKYAGTTNPAVAQCAKYAATGRSAAEHAARRRSQRRLPEHR